MSRPVCQAAINIIKSEEACVLTAYPDPASPLAKACRAAHINPIHYTNLPNWENLVGDPWTIGYGDTGPDVIPGLVINETGANDRLDAKLDLFSDSVASSISVQITDNAFGACCSLAYNIGTSNFTHSTLVRKINANDMAGAADEFPKWNKADGQVLAGLVTRRAAERTLFLTPDA